MSVYFCFLGGFEEACNKLILLSGELIYIHLSEDLAENMFLCSYHGGCIIVNACLVVTLIFQVKMENSLDREKRNKIHCVLCKNQGKVNYTQPIKKGLSVSRCL